MSQTEPGTTPGDFDDCPEGGVEHVPTDESIAEAVAKAVAEQEPTGQDKFTRCPCGEVPTDLIISMPRGSKIATVQGNCCAVWSMEFMAGFPKNESDLQLRAMAAWNEAPRG